MKHWLFIGVLFLMFSGCNGKKNAANDSAKIRDCPEVMIENRMPQIIDEDAKTPALPNKYYIYKGERREIAEFDTAWVNRHCDVEVEVVY